MKYTELKETINKWDKFQSQVAHILLREGDTLEDIIELIDNQEFMIYTSLEEYIMQAIENVSYIPDWVCIDVIGTYWSSLRYQDNLIFMKTLPKWAEGGALYGTEEEKQKYKDGIKYLCKESTVLEVYR